MDITNTFPNIKGIASVTVPTPGTAVPLTSSNTPCKRVELQAKTGNTGTIYIGASDVSSTKGIQLAKGQIYTLHIEDLIQLWIDASNANDGVTGIYLY